MEVDAKAYAIVDATHIAHQHAVDKDPHIIITGELELHVFAVRSFAISRLHKVCSELRAKVMVHDGTVRAHFFIKRQLAVSRYTLGKHIARTVKRKELSKLLIAQSGRMDRRGVVEHK